jgi:hypothetical protein
MRLQPPATRLRLLAAARRCVLRAKPWLLFCWLLAQAGAFEVRDTPAPCEFAQEQMSTVGAKHALGGVPVAVVGAVLLRSFT